jgi:hypothetical protein
MPDDLFKEDWRYLPKPTVVADFWVYSHTEDRLYSNGGSDKVKVADLETHRMGSEPKGAVLVPGTERTV